MIRFSKIDDELNIYRDRKVILFGAGNCGIRTKAELERGGVKINCFCDNDAEKWGTAIKGLAVISPSELYQVYNEETLIQICSVYSKEIEEQLKLLHMESFISYEEYCVRINGLCMYKNLPEYLEIYRSLHSDPGYMVLQIQEKCLEYAARVRYFHFDSYNIVCLPPKTGNYTLESSLRRYHEEYIRISPCFDRISHELKHFLKDKRIKIITAVRDPIAQNISFFFQSNTRFCDIPEYWKEGGNVQVLWDAWISHVLGQEIWQDRKNMRESHEIAFTYMDCINDMLHNMICMQNFFQENFEKYNHIDVYQYPFDKEKGYSIIQDGNMEIFIYQLEKLNDVSKELGEFLGIENMELINDNVGAEKWYAPAYKQALDELKISRDYFEYSYNSELVRHFYSEEDINRFRNRWSKNIDGSYI